MITQETAARIWNCYREIEEKENLLKQIRIAKENNKPFPKIPESILNDQIISRRAELVKANEQARIELDQELGK